MPEFALQGVERTLLIPLWARGVEAKKPRPMFVDRRAGELLDEIAFDFGIFRRAYGTQIGCVLRCLLYDRWVADFLRRHPEGTVVELGVGLSTRFDRLDNGLARWIDVDLPDVIELRRRYVPPSSERRIHVASSVVSAACMDEIRAHARGPTLFVSEGMLMYLSEPDVRELFRRIAEAFPHAELALDSIAPVVVRNQHHHDSMKHMLDAPFRWAIDDVRAIEGWDRRLEVVEVLDLADISRRFGEVPRRLRLAGAVIKAAAPRFTSAYRLCRVRRR